MTIKLINRFIIAFSALMLGGCVSYSITEQDMTKYLQDSVMLEQEVGVQSVMYAQVAVDDLEVKIGRTDNQRVSVIANTNAKVEIFNMPNMGLDLDIHRPQSNQPRAPYRQTDTRQPNRQSHGNETNQ